MDSTLRAFRTIQPCECHPIRTLQYSTTGASILVVAGNAQVRSAFQLTIYFCQIKTLYSNMIYYMAD